MRILSNRIKQDLVVLSFAALTCGSPAFAQAQPNVETSKAARIMATSVCGYCHGSEGRSTNPAIPNLAGQQRTYLELELSEFREHLRRDPASEHYNWGMTSAWLASEDLSKAIAAYFADQPAPPGQPGDQSVVTLGKQLYEKDNPATHYPSCAGCHGKFAEGLSVFPRLAGQHAEYLMKQMLAQRVVLRDSPPLHSGVLQLSDNQITALATYLGSL